MEAATSMATVSDVPVPAKILELSNEVLLNIAGHVDPVDLLSLRRTCKLLSHIVFYRFATVFFEERVHVLSKPGLESLVKYTEDPIFAPFINTVLIEQGGKNQRAGYHSLIDKALANLAVFGKPISIGVRRSTNANRVSSIHPHPRAASRSIARILENSMMRAVQNVSLTLESVVIDLEEPQTSGLQTRPDDYGHFDSWLKSAANSNQAQFDIHVRFYVHGRVGTAPMPYMTFTRQNVCLTGERLSLYHMWTLRDWYSFLNLREIHFQDCDLADYVSGLAFHPHLQKLTLERCHLYAAYHRPEINPIKSSSWERFLEPFARCNNLTHCRLSELWTGMNSVWLRGGDHAFEAHGADKVRTGIRNLINGLRGPNLGDVNQQP